MELDYDIYSLTFVKFRTVNNPMHHKQLIIRSVMTFSAQSALVVLIFAETGFSDV